MYLISLYISFRKIEPSDQSHMVSYFVTDHLGSTTRLINTNGTEYSETDYLSWGYDGLTPLAMGTSFKYTGQRQAEAGLYFYNARWYDPELGRFIQADSIIPEPGNPLAWDRYAYANNNPVNSIDPSGHKPLDDDDVIPTQTPGPYPPKPSTTAEPLYTDEPQLSTTPTLTPTRTETPVPGSKTTEPESLINSTTIRELGMVADVLGMLKVAKYSNLPGLIGFGIDLAAQGLDDALTGEYSFGEILLRGGAVGLEGQGIGWLATGSGAALGGVGTGVTGPGGIVMAIGTYGLVSYAGEGVADAFNDKYLFPAIHDMFN
jgi:RHS repeat-associated protein